MSAYYIDIPCLKCFFEQQKQNPLALPTYYRFLVNTSGIYQDTCENGHTIDCCLQGRNFEVLINAAVNSFVQNDFRGAIMDMASAQERFFEFILNVLVEDLKLDINSTNLQEYLKSIKTRSDNELHVFLTLYAARFKTIPFKMRDFNKNAKIRNSVVHKGEIIKRQDAEQYCEYTIKIIQDILQTILENIDEDVIHKIRFDDQKAANSALVNSMISWTTQTPAEIENESKLKAIADQNAHYYANMASQANQENKILWTENNHLILIDPNNKPGSDQPKKYSYKTTFKKMIENHSFMQNSMERFKIINKF